jgi:uncharacterized membrane protein
MVRLIDLFSDLPLAIGLVFFLIGLLLIYLIIVFAVRVGVDGSKTSKMIKEFIELKRNDQND